MNGLLAHWELMMARMRTAIVSIVCALPTILPGAANAQYPQRAILPANCELKLKDAAILFYALELYDGCIVYFDPSIKQVKLTVVTLTLHGKSTIDLTPRVTLPPAPSKPPTPPQPGEDLPAQHGSDGTRGGDGRAGTSLDINIQTLIATEGSLWIKTDGTAGGAAVRAAMERKVLGRTLAEHIVTTPDGVVMAAGEETEAMVATPQK